MTGLGRRKIFIIDDNEDMAAVYQKILSNEGYDAEFFLDHESALMALEKLGNLPCLVFLDFMMPGLSARDFIAKLGERNPRFGEKSRLIIFSSLSPDSPSLGDIASHCYGFREKPMDIDEFLKLVGESLPEASS